jgi:hypothetical protein
MAGSADITGTQHYVLGIGHPSRKQVDESTPDATASQNNLTRDKSIVLSKGFVAKPFTTSQSTGGWNKNNDSSFTLTESPLTYGDGKKMIRLTNVSGADSFMTIRSVVSIDAVGLSGKVEIPVFIPTNLSTGVTVAISISDIVSGSNPPTASAANRRAFTFQPSQFKRGQVQSLSVNLDCTANTTPNPTDGTTVTIIGSAVNTSVIRQIQIIVYMPAVGDKYVDIGEITFGNYSTPTVMMIFDGAGADTTHLAYVLPLLEKYNLKACFSPQGQTIPSCTQMLNYLVNQGHEVANEGLNHTNYFNNPATFTADVTQANNNYAAIGIATDSYKKIYAAAQNELSIAQINELIARGYTFIRAGNRAITPIPTVGSEPKTPIGAFSTGAKTGAQLINALDTVELHGEAVLCLFHAIPNIAAGTATGTDVALPDFTEFIDELALRISQGRMVNMGLVNYVEASNNPIDAIIS